VLSRKSPEGSERFFCLTLINSNTHTMKIENFLKKVAEVQKQKLNRDFKSGWIVLAIGIILMGLSFFFPKGNELGLMALLAAIFAVGLGLGAIGGSLRISNKVLAESAGFQLMQDGVLKEREKEENEK
jgi:hypothetical protein